MQVAGRSVLEIVIGLRRAGLAAALALGAVAVLLVPALARAEAPPLHHGAPKITGPLEAGRLLSASEGKWKSATKPSFSYQWEVCEPKHGPCSLISGADGSTYRTNGEQVGRRLRAIITATTPGGTASVTSRPSKKIVPGSPLEIEPPAVEGDLKEGAKLLANPGVWAGSGPITYHYQWERCGALTAICEVISGATAATYTLEAADVASSMVVKVLASNPVGTASATSPETSVVGAQLPVDLKLPSILGLLRDGQLLSAEPGSWSGSEPISYAYQWLACNAAGESCSEISKAAGPTLKLLSGLIGETVEVVVTATNGAGSTSATSPPTSIVEGLLPSNSGAPRILGSLLEGQLLSAEPGSWSGSEPISYAYQWLSCNAAGEACSEISKATGSTLKLVSGLIGDTVEVVVTATSVAGSHSVTSSPTGLVAGILPSNTGAAPSVLGSLLEGQTLSVNPGSWSGSEPISYAYQWLSCNAAGEACSEISKATGSTLKLLSGLIGDTVEVVVTATNVAGSHSVTSSPTGLVAGILPSNTGAAPSVLGSLVEGQTLSVNPGSWSGSEPISYAYQWLSCNAAGEACGEISKATGSTLKLLSGLIGDTVEVVVTATNVAGSHSVTSSPTGLVAGILPSNTGAAPSVLGSLVEGQTLSANPGSWSGSEPISYAYQWLSCNAAGEACSEISKATGSTLKLLSGLIGDTVEVVVTATNVAGSHSVTSSPSGKIGGIVPANEVLPSITGSVLSGQLLSAHPGTWSGSEPITYSYQWQLCSALGKGCANIGEAAGSTFKLVGLDVGLTLDVVVTAKNVAGSSPATSPVTGLIGL